MDSASQSRRGGLVKRRLFDASRYSLQGLRACFRHEEAFRTELGIALVLTPLAFVVARTALDLVLLLGVMVLVLIVELLNSAVESVVDLHGSERRARRRSGIRASGAATGTARRRRRPRQRRRR